MLTSTSSRTEPSEFKMFPYFIVFGNASEADPWLNVTTLSNMSNVLPPLSRITVIAPVPGIVAGAAIVSS